MSREHFEEMLDYYQREMIYLRNAGGRFAERYPEIAQGLDLSHTGSTDPHVERLIESFAFLTARLQKEVDNKFVRFADTMLDVLYPNFTRPFPSCAIAEFRIDPSLGKSTIGFEVEKGTPLYLDTESGQTCRFQTSYPVRLWPLDLIQAEILPLDETRISPLDVTSDYVLRLRIHRDDGALSEVALDQLRIHLAGDHLTRNFLYDAIFSYDPYSPSPLYIHPDTEDEPRFAAGSTVKQVGFADNEDLVPYPHQVHAGYRYLQELFTFPQKFHFLDITDLDTNTCESHLDILIPLAAGVKTDRFRISEKNFKLGCTPIVNLFKKITEPIDLDQKSVSYKMVADQREVDFTEIHTIEKVLAAVPDQPNPVEYSPYFSYTHEIAEKGQSLFWNSYRMPSSQKDVAGSDIFLTFLDYDFTPQQPANQTIFAHVLCTNRNLAEHLPSGSELQVEGKIPSSTITCLERPTPQINAVMEGETMWRIISQLSLNHLTLMGTPEGLNSFKEMLRLYAESNKTSSHSEITALQGVSYSLVTRRMAHDAWRGFIQGVSVELSSNDTQCDGNGTFLLGTVLSHFLHTYVSLNSFAELTLKSTKMSGTWKQWPPRIGDQPLV